MRSARPSNTAALIALLAALPARSGLPAPRYLGRILAPILFTSLLLGGIHGVYDSAQATPRTVLGELFTSDP